MRAADLTNVVVTEMGWAWKPVAAVARGLSVTVGFIAPSGVS
jgi:hypothetical protein